MLLGAQLRRLREAAGITRDDAGYHIRASGSKISRLELGRVSFKERDVTDLLDLYGVTAQGERDQLGALAREANSPAWWQKYSDVVPDWFQIYVGLEEAAELIRVYEVQFVPGLLQTEEYARAVVKQGQPAAAAASSCGPGRPRPGCGPWWTRARCAGRSAARRSCRARSSG